MKPTREEVISDNNGKQEISESFLVLLAGGFVLFTILYNVLFLTVIKTVKSCVILVFKG